MIFYLNKGLILEEKIVEALKNYFDTLEVVNDYKNFSINITNEHPFNTLLGSGGQEVEAASLFPAIVVTTSEDSKPGQLDHLVETRAWTLEPADIDQIIPSGYEIIPEAVEKIRAAVNGRKELYGICFEINRSDKIAIEIWCENIQLKNELYEKVRLFVCGMMKYNLENKHKTLTIFDNTVHGQRSNNFNYDFGIDLAGSLITFDADYIVEQSVIDTELIEINKDIILEVYNHVYKG
jgi:hypothetical protein